jgi:hypothetical protein
MPTTKIDYQRIVEDIQNAISSDALAPDGVLNELAADYRVACEEANQRLRECADLLRKGLRGEAIQRCEVDPNLLDLVAALDFPDRTAWCDWLRQSGHAAPPALSMEAAAELNAAYAAEQPLAALMKRHRLLALSRAPLRDRIAIVRQLAQADPATAIWGDDLRQYESQRHKQLQAEVDGAARAGDAGRLGVLEQELREPFWLEAPPPALMQRVAGFANRLRAEQARAEMLQLEPQLNAAFSDFDVELARRLRGRWKACQMLAGLAEADPLNELVTPVLDWLDEQDQRDQANTEHARALAELEQGLDDERSHHDLDRLYHRLVSCDRGVPVVLERRWQERKAALTLGDSRRNKLFFVGITVAAVVAGGGIWFWIGNQLRETEVAEAAKSLHALLDEAKVTEAQEYLDLLGREKSWLHERPEMEELHARLGGMVKDESDRRAAFVSALSGAQSAGLDRPDQNLLGEARRLAARSGEKAEVLKLERLIAVRQRELQDDINQSFSAKVDEIRLRMEQLEADFPDDLQQRLEATNRLEREAAGLVVSDTGGAEAALVNNAKALHTRLRALIDTGNHQIDQLHRMQEITAAVGNRAQFRHRLAEYIKRFPGSKRSADFQKVIDGDVSLDEPLDKWNKLTAEFSTLDPHSITPERAAARIAEANPLLNEWRNEPRAALIRERVAVLEPIARRGAGEARIEAPLKELFRYPTMSGLKVVKTKAGECYYIDDDPRSSANVVTISYIKDFKLSKHLRTLKREELLDDAIVEAPQSVVGREVLKELHQLEDVHWEAAFCRMASAVHDHKDLDPILKVQLLLQVLSVAKTGSLVLDHAFAKYFDRLNDSGLDGTVNWLDPYDKGAAKARETAAELLRRLPSIHSARDAAAKEYAHLRKPWPAPHYRWVGWLWLAEDGIWKCASQPLPEPWSADLVLLSQSGQPPTVDLTNVGRLANGHAVIGGDSPMLLEGRPVYAAVIDPKAK